MITFDSFYSCLFVSVSVTNSVKIQVTHHFMFQCVHYFVDEHQKNRIWMFLCLTLNSCSERRVFPACCCSDEDSCYLFVDEMFSSVICDSLLRVRHYADVTHTWAAMSRSISASSLTSSSREYRLGVLLWLNSRSSLESLGRRAAFSWACWCASSARRTTSCTSWLRPWEWGCWGSALRWGLLLMTSRLRLSAWEDVERTDIRTCREQRVDNIFYSTTCTLADRSKSEETVTVN